jgi:hypothetical protein
LRWRRKLSLDFPITVEVILFDEDERPELFAYFVQGGCSQVLDNAHGNVYFGVANEDKKDAHNAIRASTPGQVIDLPKPPDHIIVDINLIKGIKCLIISTFHKIQI